MSGQYLSMNEREPFVGLAPACGETEASVRNKLSRKCDGYRTHSFVKSSEWRALIGVVNVRYGCNVGKQLETLEKKGSVMIEGLCESEQITALRQDLPDGATESP
eukprot:1015351-Amphidinium_carterae.2